MKKIIINILMSLFVLSSFEGEAKLVSSLELKKEALANILIFISKDCPCSKGNITYLNKLASEFNNFHFIAIHSKKNTTNEQVQDYLKDKNLKFDIVNDSDLKVANTYHALKTPHAFILRGDEILYNGGITNTTLPENAKEHYLKDALMAISKNEKPLKIETRTLGCFIVR